MKLDYHQDGRYFNGLLSRQTWKSSADSVSRKYLYDYDKSYRLIKGAFTGKLSEKFNENTSYDANGNILTLNRFGKVATSSYERIDSLAYFINQIQINLQVFLIFLTQPLGLKTIAS